MTTSNVTGQLWYVDGQLVGATAPNETGAPADEIGRINSDGSSQTALVESPAGASALNYPDYVAVAVDTAAGYYWVVDDSDTSPSDPTAQSLIEYKIGSSTPIATIPINNPADADQTTNVVIDAINHRLYVSTWGFDQTFSGIKEFTYDPVTGATSAITSGTGQSGVYGSGAAGGFILSGDGTTAGNTAVSNIVSMSLDTTNQLMYFSADDEGFNGNAPASEPSNAVYVENLATRQVTQLTSSTQFPTGSQTAGFNTVDTGGAISGVAVDVADGKVFFLTGGIFRSSTGTFTPTTKLWSVSTTGGANQTATQIALPTGVTLSNDGLFAGLTYDSVNRQLYISSQDAANATGVSQGSVIVAQLGAGGTSVTSATQTFTDQTLNPIAFATDSGTQLHDSGMPLGLQYVSLPVPVFTGAGGFALPNGAGVALLGSGSTSSDASNGSYIGATVQITGGTFTTGDTSASDDHLSIAGAISAKISVSYNSATETLTLSGYDTIADYNAALKQVQYNVTGANPANSGANTARTVTWTLLDGQSNIPAGSSNSTTTTANIAVAPVVGAGNTVNYNTSTKTPVALDASLTVSDADSATLVGATATISAGLISGDTLNFAAQNGITGNYNAATGVLTLTGTATVANYQAALRSITYSSSAADPSAAGADTVRTIGWQVNDGTLPSAVESTTLDIIPCYCEGTRILTARGEVAVEDLREGDLAVTASGALRPVVWIGSRRLDTARHCAPANVWPVRISAGAFGENQPRHDLWVSPGHNIAVEGVMIPAILLANGATVAQVETGSVTYYHVELDAHDILLAEGLPAESYLDCGNRDAFANGGGALELHPDFGPKNWSDACLPIHKDGPAVETAKAKLLARAEALGHIMTSDPDPRLIADGRVIHPARGDRRRHVFAIPRGARRLVLASRQWRPGHMSPASADDRLLGMLVTRLECDGVAQPLAAMGEGWSALESADWRWTGGRAVLPPATREIVVEIDGAPLYWRPDAAAELFGFARACNGRP